MTLCPIALVVGCKKCPAFSVCPLKGVIGDYRKQEETQIKQQTDDDKK
ncbi:MAG: hypothetical protein IH899_09455 [Planctomycetes bacterium]|nr:hypothetical protein [Planctomycetota bacterium]